MDALEIASRVSAKNGWGKSPEDGICVDALFKCVGEHRRDSNRDAAFRMLAHLVDSPLIGAYEGRFLNSIENLPSTVEAMAGACERSEGLIQYIDALMMCETVDFTTRMQKILPKFITVLTRVIGKGEQVEFAISLVRVLVGTFRNKMSQNFSMLTGLLLELLVNPVHRSSVASLLALIHSFDTPDEWIQCLSTYAIELAKVVLDMGMYVNGLNPSAIRSAPSIRIQDLAGSLAGKEKAIYCEELFKGYAEICEQMLSNGCACGTVAFDLSVLVPVLSAMLSLHLDVNNNDAKSLIENECGLSPADLSLVYLEMKVSSIGVLNALLATQSVGLFRVASAIYRPIINALGTRDAQTHIGLLSALLHGLKLSTKCFPSLVASSANSSQAGGLHILADMLQSLIHAVCASKTTVTTVDSSIGKSQPDSLHGSVSKGMDVYLQSESKAAALAEEVFAACESVLLHCGPMLSAKLRDRLEHSVAQGLACLLKGIVPFQYADRRLRRCPCEYLRSHATLQKSLIQLATTEVLSRHKHGMLSGNVSLLRQVCESASRAPDVASDAARALLAIDALMHPAALSIPSSNATMIMAKLLNESEGTSAYTEREHTYTTANGVPSSSGNVSSEINAPEAASVGVGMKRGREQGVLTEEDDGETPSPEALPATETRASGPAKKGLEIGDIKLSASILGSSSGVNNDDDGDDDEDDDDSIPDIVM